jgi:hypothetical protein
MSLAPFTHALVGDAIMCSSSSDAVKTTRQELRLVYCVDWPFLWVADWHAHPEPDSAEHLTMTKVSRDLDAPCSHDWVLLVWAGVNHDCSFCLCHDQATRHTSHQKRYQMAHPDTVFGTPVVDNGAVHLSCGTPIQIKTHDPTMWQVQTVAQNPHLFALCGQLIAIHSLSRHTQYPYRILTLSSHTIVSVSQFGCGSQVNVSTTRHCTCEWVYGHTLTYFNAS